ncbi:MAG TPA: hypothetical protein RMH99_11435 [Sandaracinaceae bacterium LLY-WYZ-13_1]|nr:hypothetical protein [Sandaracinaceae bacterium LLY-WYZ-13_1]
MTRQSCFVLALATLLATATARAQPPDPDAMSEAQRHFEMGTQAFDTGDYELAVSEFRRAHELTGHPDLLFNIYSAAERAGRLEEAEDALAAHLEEGEISEERRPVLEQRLARLRARIAARADAASPGDEPEDPDAAAPEAVRSDSTAETSPPPSSAGAPDATGPDRAAEATSADAPGTPAPSSGGGVHPAAVGTLIAAGVLAASFGVFAGLSEAEDVSLADRCGRDRYRSCGDGDLATLEAYNLVADVSWIGAAAMGVTGLILLFALPAEGGGDDVAVAPWAHPTAAGGAAMGRF